MKTLITLVLILAPFITHSQKLNLYDLENICTSETYQIAIEKLKPFGFKQSGEDILPEIGHYLILKNEKLKTEIQLTTTKNNFSLTYITYKLNGLSNIEKDLTRSDYAYDENKSLYVKTKGDLEVNISAIRNENQIVMAYSIIAMDLKPLEKGESVSNITVLDIDKSMKTLGDLKGKYLYIVHWASWCKYCMTDIPHIKNLYKSLNSFERQRLEIVLINCDEEEGKWEKALKGMGLGFFKNYKNLPTYRNNSEIELDLKGYPHFSLIGPDGGLISSSIHKPGQVNKKVLIEYIK